LPLATRRTAGTATLLARFDRRFRQAASLLAEAMYERQMKVARDGYV
jgi:hypothetical protein